MALRKMKAAKNKWAYATGPVSATVAMLIDVGVNPVHPTLWKIPAALRDEVRSEASADPQKEYQLSPKHDIHAHHRARYEISRIAEGKVWRSAATQDSGGGLDKGQPLLQPALNVYQSLIKKNRN